VRVGSAGGYSWSFMASREPGATKTILHLSSSSLPAHTHTHTQTLRQERRKREPRCARNTSVGAQKTGNKGLGLTAVAAAELGAFAPLAGAGTGGRDFSGISRATCSGHSNTFCRGARRMRRILNEAASVHAQTHKYMHGPHACTHVQTFAHELRGCGRAHTLPSAAQVRPRFKGSRREIGAALPG
jgi:hypothetical protein